MLYNPKLYTAKLNYKPETHHLSHSNLLVTRFQCITQRMCFCVGHWLIQQLVVPDTVQAVMRLEALCSGVVCPSVCAYICVSIPGGGFLRPACF